MKPSELTEPTLEEARNIAPSSRPFGGISYFYGGTIAIIISWVMTTALSGCQFGDYTSTPATPDTVTGYYGATPQSLQFCVTTSATACAQAATTQIPSLITAEITNPVALIVQDASTGAAILTDASGTGQTGLPIWVQSDNTTLYYTNSGAPQTLWQDPTCTTTTYLDESGVIVAGMGGAVAGTTSVTSGTLTLKVSVIQTFDSTTGSCASELQLMSGCYQNASLCGGADSATNQQLQAQAVSIFSASIQAGAMAVSDIPNAVNVSYEVHYQ